MLKTNLVKMVLVTVLLTITGTSFAGIDYGSNSVGSNKAIANNIIQNELETVAAEKMLSATYDGFYQIKGRAAKDKFSFKKVTSKKSFPDDRWEQVAKSIAGQVRIPAPSTSTRIKPRATAYIAFYKGGIEGFDPQNVTQLSTSGGGEPNTLAVLMIKSQTSKSSTMFTEFGGTPNIYFFELAM